MNGHTRRFWTISALLLILVVVLDTIAIAAVLWRLFHILNDVFDDLTK